MNLILTSNVSAIVDVVALVFILVFALWGLIRGFVKTFFSAFGTIISLLLAVLLAPAVAEFVQSKFGAIDCVSQAVSGFLTERFGEELMNMPLGEATKEVLASAGLYGFIIDVVLTLKTDIPSSTANLKQIVCPTFAYYVVIIISIIALFIIFKLIMRLICDIVKKMHKFKSIARLDRLFGFLFGLLHGIIILEFVILFVKIIPIGFLQDIYVGIQASTFASIIEKISLYNILLGALTKVNVAGFIKGLLTNIV